MFTASRSGRASVTNASTKTKSSLSKTDVVGGTDSDPVKMVENAGSTSFRTYEKARSSSTDRIGSSFSTRKNRGSLLVAATDVFNFRFGRKRPIIRPPPPLPIILPDVIEISAPPPDQEVEERNRLREMAAQAIGISPYMGQPDSHSQASTEDDEDQDVLRTPVDSSELRRFGDIRNSESAPDFTNKNISVDTNLSSIPPSFSSRARSGSMVHTRASSVSFSPIPPFPTNVLSLNPCLTCSGYLPKYTQPSSMRIFALSSKNWKNRYIVFTSPANLFSTGHTTPVSSYLHVFKSSGPDEKELERLEINESSVIFVAEDEVGSRRSVIKVGGLSITEGKLDRQTENAQQTMWHLQITDASESQGWISAIKNAILGQRTVRAGLIVPASPGGFEPRGDLDVMLSIRAQGLATALQATTSPIAIQDPVSPTFPSDPHYASSVSSRSIRSQTTIPKTVSVNAVSAFKGLFTNRPRSTSRATNASVDVERQLDRERLNGSLSPTGSNRTKLRSNSVVEARSNTASPLSNPVQPRDNIPFSVNGFNTEGNAERKILAERNNQWSDQIIRTAIQKENRANRSLSLSLQPPPRKRWNNAQRPMSINPSDEIRFTYVNRDSSATTVFPPPDSETEVEPVDFTSFTFPQVERRPRAPSLHSVSTHSSDKAMSMDRSSVSTKRSSGTTNRRWSRPLPQRLTPPSGPPPAVPQASSVTRLHIHPYGIEDRPPSTTSTISSAQSQRSVVSTLPTFAKRTSSSSSSISSGNVTPTSPVRSSHRHSMPPPPRPPPTSNLPPAPIQPEDTSTTPPLPTPPATKTSFRNSVAQRAMRLSMMAPKPPPSANLPPRPDEAEVNAKTNKAHHRRSSSSGRSQILSAILEPVKQRDHHSTSNPHPPPAGPLPPPPNQGTSTPTAGPTPPISRHSSLKHRLRIRSTPSPINSVAPLPPPARFSNPTPVTTPMVPYFTNSTPSTPMGDKFAFISNNDHTSSFLQMNTPTLSSVPPSRIFEEALIDGQAEAVELLDHVTSLSPPPRRHSKPLIETALIPEPEINNNDSLLAALGSAFHMTSTNSQNDDRNEESDPKTPRMFSLSPPGSVASLPLVNL
ncbi:hypothetical protein FA15DRAFT_612819 [Coprinopsis marcescibilis]|uniref:PH domain-containing protein n=1 Tax=Coprinopsis marcescibilis TaxID=230819 RepID=A0A5C3L5Q1_COPMA|nr:hypothetical protein FA15DRAFT_612819 [Coprinopsis marcescibilis]